MTMTKAAIKSDKAIFNTKAKVTGHWPWCRQRGLY